MVTKKLFGLLCGMLLLVGCATSQETTADPGVVVPPAVDNSVPNVEITRNKYKRNGVAVYEWKRLETAYNTVIMARREEAFEIRLILILGIETDVPMLSEGMYDSRGTDDYEVYNYNMGGIQGVALVFKNHYKFLFMNMPTNTMYVQYPVQGIFDFELTQAEWNDMINAVINKEGF